jgi:hypothetical protein
MTRGAGPWYAEPLPGAGLQTAPRGCRTLTREDLELLLS